MISFYPGPSRVFTQVPQYVQEAYEQGVLSINHRSEEFVAISSRTIHLLKQRLKIPDDYTVFFTSSATECWEVISQSLVRKASFHIYNGAFGEKWHSYSQKLQSRAYGWSFGREEKVDPQKLKIPADAEVIALTHNETSNGTAMPQGVLREIRQQYEDRLIAIDATSSMAGVFLDMKMADIWYASVQKCFGLPAGMAVLVCSPEAVKKARAIGEKGHYNSLVFMAEQMQHWQTTYTPNVLGIYLLMRTLENRPDIEQTENMIRKRYQSWMESLSALYCIDLLVQNEEVRSSTVIALESVPENINRLRREAKQAGIIIGNGYGKLKPYTLRIANFPAIEDHEIEKLQKLLNSFC